MTYSEDFETEKEILKAASQISGGAPVAAALVGQEVRPRATELIEHGADQVFVAEDASLAQFNVETYVGTLESAAAQFTPAVILLGATRRGRELAPRLATRLKTGCVADCINLRVEEDQLTMDRVVYSGKAVASLVCTSRPVVCSVKPHVFEKERKEGRRGEVVALDLKVRDPRSKVTGGHERPTAKVNLSEAKIIVSVGRGMKKKEDIALIRDLANVLGGEVGCTRPLSSDLGWLSEEHHVGISGMSVKPHLYLAIGISGQLQHVVGMRDSRVVAAINIDKDAPIFAASDYCVVGDLYQVVPALTKSFKQMLNK